MGSCCSSPSDKYAADTPSKPPATSGKSKSSAPPPKPSVPTFGLESTHEIIKLLGQGGEGETWLARDKESMQQVAIKLIKRPIPKPALAIIKREVKIQADLGQGHINIVSADEVILSKSHLGLILEYVPGGNMVNYVTRMRENKGQRGGLCMDEEEALYFFKQLVSAVDYCHRNQVAHRDLKLDNTLLDNHNPAWIKLCDFGFAKHWQASSNMDTMRIGTPEYMGPELISSRTGYDGKKVDVWALGVLLYVMLVGMFPFETQDDNYNNTAGLYDIWLQQIKTTWREVPNNSNAASRLTPELKDLLDKMFDIKQDSRPTVEGIKAHAWFKRPLPQRYQDALDELAKEQVKIDVVVAKGSTYSAERDKSLEALLDKAAIPALPTEEIARMNLSKLKRGHAVIMDKMEALAEEEE